MNQTLLTIDNLSVSFKQYEGWFKQKQFHVIHQLNLQVFAGEILVIFGASGSGKSLLAHSCLGLLPPNALVRGNIMWKGQNMTPLLTSQLRGNEISFIPQTIQSLNPLLKIKQQVGRNLTSDEEAYHTLVNHLEHFGLDAGVLDKYPGQLSGGMARKILVSMSILNQPELIIADEPTPGMDSLGLDYIVDYMNSEKSQGTSAVIISHDIETALGIADRVAIFYQGQIIDVVTPDQFTGQGENLSHPYTRSLWQALPQNGFHLPTQEEIQEWEAAK